MAREVAYITKELTAGTFILPCGTIWFTVSPADAQVDAEFQITGTTGDTLNYRNIALTSPENMPFKSHGTETIEIGWVEGTININYIA